MTPPVQITIADTPLSLFKHCPYCGSDSFRLRGRNELFCRICDFVFYFNPPVSVVALIKNDQNKLLLTQRKLPPGKGKFDFPGGFVDMGESLETALKREIREELNLEIFDLHYFDSFVTTYPCKGITYYPVDAVFQCRIKDWNSLLVQDDVKSVCFKSPGEITDVELAFDSHRLLVKKLQSIRTE